MAFSSVERAEGRSDDLFYLQNADKPGRASYFGSVMVENVLRARMTLMRESRMGRECESLHANREHPANRARMDANR